MLSKVYLTLPNSPPRLRDFFFILKLLNKARAKEELIGKVPKAIKTFEEAFQGLETRLQKAQLQTIFKAAHICREGKIELEFRGEKCLR